MSEFSVEYPGVGYDSEVYPQGIPATPAHLGENNDRCIKQINFETAVKDVWTESIIVNTVDCPRYPYLDVSELREWGKQ